MIMVATILLFALILVMAVFNAFLRKKAYLAMVDGDPDPVLVIPIAFPFVRQRRIKKRLTEEIGSIWRSTTGLTDTKKNLIGEFNPGIEEASGENPCSHAIDSSTVKDAEEFIKDFKNEKWENGTQSSQKFSFRKDCRCLPQTPRNLGAHVREACS